MTHEPASSSPSSPDRRTRDPLNWALISGLAALALLHPLAGLLGLHDDGGGAGSGGPGTAVVPLILVTLTALAWIGIVGFSRVSRPVTTLVATGLLYGVLELALATVLGPGPGLWQAPFGLGVIAVLFTSTFWGAVAGLLALAVQRLRGFAPVSDPRAESSRG
ncbi:hypothetical protein BJH93_15665 [Kocuria polaris]|nr:hypothetical protein [Kocuria polaris]